MLVKKYPIPKDDDLKEQEQIEGLNVQVTHSHQNRSDDAYNDIKYDKKYLCPITKQFMKCPVIAYDGCVYEKEAIIKYLRDYHTTPNHPNEKLDNKEEVEQMIKMLFVHFALKTEITNPH